MIIKYKKINHLSLMLLRQRQALKLFIDPSSKNVVYGIFLFLLYQYEITEIHFYLVFDNTKLAQYTIAS